MWRLLRDRLHAPDSLCVAGCEVLETARHLFLECGTSSTLWSYVSTWLSLYLVTPYELRDHHIQFCYMAGLLRCTHSYLKGIWYACVWVIWKDRNDRIFQNQITHPSVLIEKINLHSFIWMKAKQISFNYCYYDWWAHPPLYGCSPLIYFDCFFGRNPLCGSLRL